MWVAEVGGERWVVGVMGARGWWGGVGAWVVGGGVGGGGGGGGGGNEAGGEGGGEDGVCGWRIKAYSSSCLFSRKSVDKMVKTASIPPAWVKGAMAACRLVKQVSFPASYNMSAEHQTSPPSIHNSARAPSIKPERKLFTAAGSRQRPTVSAKLLLAASSLNRSIKVPAKNPTDDTSVWPYTGAAVAWRNVVAAAARRGGDGRRGGGGGGGGGGALPGHVRGSQSAPLLSQLLCSLGQ